MRDRPLTSRERGSAISMLAGLLLVLVFAPAIYAWAAEWMGTAIFVFGTLCVLAGIFGVAKP